MKSEPWYSSCCSAQTLDPEYGRCPKCKENCEFEKYDDEGNIIDTYEEA